ncbi:MAG: tail fiber domain-containing protein, partial [Taibaiella sp.]
MKKYYMLLTGTMFLAVVQTKAQTKIGGAGAPDGSAMLEVTSGASSNKGLLLPRVTTVQRNAITSPAKGLMIFNTTTNQAEINNGTPALPVWAAATATATGWNTTGNAGTTPAANFIGTTDNQPLVLRTNNTDKVRVTGTGFVGIGTNTPISKLQVDGGGLSVSNDGAISSSAINVISDNGGGLNPDNISITAYGTSNPVFGISTANGTASAPQNSQAGDNTGSLWFGPRINGAFSEITRINTVYLGDGTNNKSRLGIFTSNALAVSVDSNGYVGIGVATPQQTLHVAGTARITGSSGTATTVTGRNAAGDVSNITVGTGLSLTGGTLTAAAGGNNWGLTGNTASNPATNFIGTTDNQPLTIRTNNTEQMRVTAAGYVGVGTTAPIAKLTVVDTGNTYMVVGSSTGDMMSVSLGNGHHGMSRNLSSSGGGGNDVALYTTSGGAPVSLYLAAKPSTSDSIPLDQFVLKQTGNVGIGTNTPAQKLHVQGTVRIATAVGTPTTVTGRNAAGDVGNVTLGSGLALTGGVLNTTADNADWNLIGNTGTNPATNFIGTGDAQPLVIRTSNVEQLRVTAAGYVGVGTTAPIAKLNVVDTGNAYMVVGSSTGDMMSVSLGNGHHGMSRNLISSGGGGNDVALYTTSGGSPASLYLAAKPAISDSIPLNQFVLKSNGNVGIGNNAPKVKLQVNGGIVLGRDVNIAHGNGSFLTWSTVRSGVGETEFINYRGTGAGGFRFYDVDPGTSVDTAVYGTNNIAFIAPNTGAYSNVSDMRVKTNVNIINDGLEKVMAMRPVSYDFHTGRTLKDGVVTFTKSDKTIKTIGFLAQELANVVPEAVIIPKDPANELYTVSYATVIPVLTKAIQEQQTQIEALKAENQKLKNTEAVTAQLMERVKQMEQMM